MSSKNIPIAEKGEGILTWALSMKKGEAKQSGGAEGTIRIGKKQGPGLGGR